MYDVGISVSKALGITNENFAAMKSAGIKAAEISYDSFDGFNYNEARAIADRNGIKLWSIHLPFAPFETLDPSSLDAKKREYTFDVLADVIKRGSAIGIDKFVAHTSAEPIGISEREERLNYSVEFFSKLADVAAECGSVIAVEDLPRTCLGNCSDEILRFTNANDKIRVCFDTNHLLFEKCVDFIEKVSSKIVTLHVSDYDFVNERHWLPGEGFIYWQALVQKLTDVGYNGVWMYEISKKAPNSIIRRDLVFSDYYNNACEVLSGKMPAPIGEHINNLGFWAW